jgi:hypothetical protein
MRLQCEFCGRIHFDRPRILGRKCKYCKIGFVVDVGEFNFIDTKPRNNRHKPELVE